MKNEKRGKVVFIRTEDEGLAKFVGRFFDCPFPEQKLGDLDRIAKQRGLKYKPYIVCLEGSKREKQFSSNPGYTCKELYPK